jgi:hypothetical protein
MQVLAAVFLKLDNVRQQQIEQEHWNLTNSHVLLTIELFTSYYIGSQSCY